MTCEPARVFPWEKSDWGLPMKSNSRYGSIEDIEDHKWNDKKISNDDIDTFGKFFGKIQQGGFVESKCKLFLNKCIRGSWYISFYKIPRKGGTFASYLVRASFFNLQVEGN
jgi:hypothetical protein